MAGLLPILRVFAQQEETLLVSGPTGAGKSRLARWCHERSGRGAGPFEALDLVTVAEDRQMAELFGWKTGAFTAFRVLGRESLVRNRNHHKALKREVEKVDALLKALGEAGAPFADLLASEK